MKNDWWGRGASAQKRKHAVHGQLKRDTKYNRKSEETVRQGCLSSAQWIKQRAWLAGMQRVNQKRIRMEQGYQGEAMAVIRGTDDGVDRNCCSGSIRNVWGGQKPQGLVTA